MIETAQAFGWLPDVPFAQQSLFEPTAIATREFAAFTAVKAIGFLGEEELVCNDKNDVVFQNEAALAIKETIFSLQGGNFQPAGHAIYNDLNQALRVYHEWVELGTIKKEDYHSNIDFANGVLDLRSIDNYTFSQSGDEYTLILPNNAATNTINVGSLFVLGTNEYATSGIAVRATAVNRSGSNCAVKGIQPGIDEIFDSISFSGEGSIIPSQITTEEGVDAEYFTSSASQQLQAQSTTSPGTVVVKFTVDKEINNNAKIEGSVSVELPPPVFDLECSWWGIVPTGLEKLIIDFQAKVIGSVDISVSGSNEPFAQKFLLGEIPCGIYMGITLVIPCYLKIELDGSIGIECDVSFGYNFSYLKGRPVNSRAYFEKDFSFNASANLKIGVAPTPTFKIFGYALYDFILEAGWKLSAKPEINCPNICIDVDNSFYFDIDVCGGESPIAVLLRKLKISKIGIEVALGGWHFEKFKKVPLCTDAVIDPDSGLPPENAPVITLPNYGFGCTNRGQITTKIDVPATQGLLGANISGHMRRTGNDYRAWYDDISQGIISNTPVTYDILVNNQPVGSGASEGISDVYSVMIPADKIKPGKSNAFTSRWSTPPEHFFGTDETIITLIYAPDAELPYYGSPDTLPDVRSLPDFAVYEEDIFTEGEWFLIGEKNTVLYKVYNRGSRGGWVDIAISDGSAVVSTQKNVYIPAFSNYAFTFNYTGKAEQTFTITLTNASVGLDERNTANNTATRTVTGRNRYIPAIGEIGPAKTVVNQNACLYADISNIADITEVQFFVDGTKVAGTVAQSNQRYFINASGLNLGEHTIRIKAIYRNGASTTASVEKSATIQIADRLYSKPVLGYTITPTRVRYSTAFTAKATVTNPADVKGVTFSLDGALPVEAKIIGNECTVNYPAQEPGTHKIRVVVTYAINAQENAVEEREYIVQVLSEAESTFSFQLDSAFTNPKFYVGLSAPEQEVTPQNVSGNEYKITLPENALTSPIFIYRLFVIADNAILSALVNATDVSFTPTTCKTLTFTDSPDVAVQSLELRYLFYNNITLKTPVAKPLYLTPGTYSFWVDYTYKNSSSNFYYFDVNVLSDNATIDIAKDIVLWRFSLAELVSMSARAYYKTGDTWQSADTFWISSTDNIYTIAAHIPNADVAILVVSSPDSVFFLNGNVEDVQTLSKANLRKLTIMPEAPGATVSSVQINHNIFGSLSFSNSVVYMPPGTYDVTPTLRVNGKDEKTETQMVNLTSTDQTIIARESTKNGITISWSEAFDQTDTSVYGYAAVDAGYFYETQMHPGATIFPEKGDYTVELSLKKDSATYSIRTRANSKDQDATISVGNAFSGRTSMSGGSYNANTAIGISLSELRDALGNQLIGFSRTNADDDLKGFVTFTSTDDPTREYYVAVSASSLTSIPVQLPNIYGTYNVSVELSSDGIIRIGFPYTVTFDYQGAAGYSTTNTTVINGDTYGTLPSPSRTGYYSSGWYTMPNGEGSLITSDSTVSITANQTLYVKWTPIYYMAAFDPQGGSVSPTWKSVAYDSIYGLLPTPSREGFVFSGWYTQTNGGGMRVADTTVVNVNSGVITTAGQFSLYAKWLEVQTSGDWKYSVDNNEATIHAYTGNASSLSVPSTLGGYSVTAIGDNVFKENSTLTSVAISDTVRNIGKEAFYHCEYLASVSIPNSVMKIGEAAFQRCFRLNLPTLPNCISSIEPLTFWNDCYALNEIIVPDSVTSIGDGALDFMYSLNKIHIPVNCKNMSDLNFESAASDLTICCPSTDSYAKTYAEAKGIRFEQCNGQHSIPIPFGYTVANGKTTITRYTGSDANVVIPSTIAGYPVTEIADNTFFSNSSLKSIYIPESVTSIGPYAFIYSNEITDMRVAPDNPNYCSVGGVIFNKAKTTLVSYPPKKPGTSYKIPDGVTVIEARAFEAAVLLTAIEIPESVRNIRHYAFTGCASLTTITIPEGVTAIGAQAFENCTSLVKLVMPISVTSIGTNFSGSGFRDDLFPSTPLVSIHGYRGSLAESYASKYSIPFVALGEKEFSITFNPLGGNVNPTTKTVIFSGTYGNLPIPTRDGYSFSGWYTTTNLWGNGAGAQITESTTVSITTKQTLYAKWTAKTPGVTLDPQGGNYSGMNIRVTYGSQYGTLEKPTRTGYTFDGWCTEENGGGTQITSESTVSIAEDHTLYANWIANTYTVSFNAQGGNVGPTSKTVTYDSSYGTLPTPTRSDYIFDGWYTAINGGGTQITSSSTVAITANQTLYAKWTYDPAILLTEAKAAKIATINAVTNGLNSADYTDESWQALQTAMTNAVAQVNAATTVEAVNAIAVPTTAGLITKASELAAAKTAKIAAINAVTNGLNGDDYTVESWQALQVAMTNAIAQVNAATTVELVNAVVVPTTTGLVTKASELAAAKADKIAVINAVTNGLNSADYTVDSWQALQLAISSAIAQVNTATTIEAVDAVVVPTTAGLVTNTADLSAAKTAKIATINAVVNGLNSADYTAESWQALQTAISNAITQVNAATTVEAVNAVAVPSPSGLVRVYTLTVNNGSGSGKYAAGAMATITANTAPSGKLFDNWTATSGTLANANNAATTFAMPAGAATVTANYKDDPAVLLANAKIARIAAINAVANGLNSADYTAESWQALQSAITNAIAQVNAATTVEAVNAIALPSTSGLVRVYALTVNSGSGSGKYTANTAITITANAAPSGKVFDRWTATSGTLASPTSVSTTFTMPAGSATVTATYKDAPVQKKYIFSTKYEATFLNWILFFVCFGWIWMWF